MADIKERVETFGFDPRRETSTPPPEDQSAPAPGAMQVPKAAPVPVIKVPDGPAENLPRPEMARPAVTSVDPRFADLEPLVQMADWDGILKQLGGDDQAGKLPPNLGLLWAIARKEKETNEEKGNAALTELAIRCTAGVLGVPAESPLALLVAKRLLRKNPISWQQRPAPPPSISFLIIIIAIVLGLSVGWALSYGYVTIKIRT